MIYNIEDVSQIAEIYLHLADGLSKDIYTYRIMYSITHDRYWVEKMISTTKDGKMFLRRLKTSLLNEGAILFGTGILAPYLIKDFGKEGWLYAVDNHPHSSLFMGLPVLKFSDFLTRYKDELIVISTRIFHDDIRKQLLDAGISPDCILDFGGIDNELVKLQYFDVEAIKPESKKKEVFIDAGCFDGMTSVFFKMWRGTGAYKVYAFEPDYENQLKCLKTFKKYQIENEIIPYACWEKSTTLHFFSDGNGGSAVHKDGETIIKAKAIDDVDYDTPVTFIKMDIEGAEYKALLGAKNTISNYKPKLAISIYHKDEDIFEIPRLLLSYYPGYKFYLRHYSLSWFDTVLYAI